jgi:hypothetical protein
MRTPIHHFLVLGFIAIFSLLKPQQLPEVDSRVEEILRSDSFQYSGMAQIFQRGTSLIPQLVSDLNNPDDTVSDNAQLMLRIIGDEGGIEALHDWYGKPRPVLRIVNGPIPSPLTDWDYKHIETAILSRPYREWKTEGVNYLIALVVDGSPRAKEMLKKMLGDAPIESDGVTPVSELASRIRKGPTQGQLCTSPAGAIEDVVFENAFFLTPGERRRTEVKVLGYDDQNQSALVTVSQMFGNTFLVVLARTGSCWRYRSVSLYSTNN